MPHITVVRLWGLNILDSWAFLTVGYAFGPLPVCFVRYRDSTGSINVLDFTICLYLVLTLACSAALFCCFDLSNDTSDAISFGLLKSTIVNQFTSCGQFTTLCTVRIANISWPAERGLSTTFWFAVSHSSTSLFTSSSTCTGIQPTLSQTKRF